MVWVALQAVYSCDEMLRCGRAVVLRLNVRDGGCQLVEVPARWNVGLVDPRAGPISVIDERSNSDSGP